jgi:hypothetical protein
MKGKTIRIFLADGAPNGVLTGQHGNSGAIEIAAGG